MTRTLDNASLELLRAIFDLVDVGVEPTIDLLGRLLDIDANHAIALVAGLRRMGLVPRDRLGLTMAGLAMSAGVTETRLRPMRATVRVLRAA